MRTITLVLLFTFVCLPTYAGKDSEVLEFKAKIGFSNSDDAIVGHRFFDNGRKLLLIGMRTLQIWDVENAKLLNSVPHDIPQFEPKGFISTYLLLGLPQILHWTFYVVDPNGKWIITVEKVGDNSLRSAVVRDLLTAKQIAVLDVPNVSTNAVTFDTAKNQIVTLGRTDKTATFSTWDPDTFKLKGSISIADYKWHQLIRNETKMVVGSGDSKILWTGPNIKQGGSLTLRDVKTGAVEKEYTAKGLMPDTSFQETTVSGDEKHLVAVRDKRIFVWDIEGEGSPKFELASTDPKVPFEFQSLPGQHFLAVSRDKNLLVYDLEGDGKPKYEISSLPPMNRVSVVAMSKDGRYFATHQDEKTSLFETAGDGKPIFEVTRAGPKDRFWTVTFMDDDNYFLVSHTNKSQGKPPSTVFYDLKQGKLAFEIPVNVGSPAFVQKKKFLYSEFIGKTLVWNFAENKAFTIPLRTYEQSCGADDIGCVDNGPVNTEFTVLSPDEKLILKYGNYDVSIFDVQTGKKIQTIFDADRVKYDKQNQVKKSGLGEAGWSEDGKFVYAFDEAGIFRKPRSVSLWAVK